MEGGEKWRKRKRSKARMMRVQLHKKRGGNEVRVQIYIHSYCGIFTVAVRLCCSDGHCAAWNAWKV